MTIAVPDDLDEALSPEWLTAALTPRFPGIVVDAVSRGPVVERLSTNARFTIDGQLPPDVPRNLCVKGYFGAAGRCIQFVGAPEAAFYRDLAEPSGVATLRPVYADVDPVTRHGVVVTRDEVAAGSRFLGGADCLTVDQASEALTELARLHAGTWTSPRLAQTPWLEPRIGRAVEVWGEARTLETISLNLLGDNGYAVPEHLSDARALLTAHAMLAADGLDGGWCVIHGDAHVGNVVVDARGHPRLADWQLVQRGRWQLDVGYLLASALLPDQRRASERKLLTHYLTQLAVFGVAPPAFDRAWSLIGEGMVHGMFLWAITTKVAPDVIGVLLGRLAAAVADHDALNRASTKGTR